MPNIRCLIVDDEEIAQRIISQYLKDLGGFDVISTCFNAMEAMSIIEKEPIDLIFLDIEMPKLNGLAFLKTFKNPPAVIITTAHREYALEGYEVEAIDYLLKPISFERFIKAIHKYKKLSKINVLEKQPDLESSNPFILVKSDRKTLKLKINKIEFIEGMNNYLIIHISEQKHIVYMSISELLSQLDSNFVRIHKSFVVNKSKIISFTKEQLELKQKSLPIGRTYRDVISNF